VQQVLLVQQSWQLPGRLAAAELQATQLQVWQLLLLLATVVVYQLRSLQQELL
jgi:hypothetical protein